MRDNFSIDLCVLALERNDDDKARAGDWLFSSGTKALEQMAADALRSQEEKKRMRTRRACNVCPRQLRAISLCSPLTLYSCHSQCTCSVFVRSITPSRAASLTASSSRTHHTPVDDHAIHPVCHLHSSSIHEVSNAGGVIE
jgi:hypothetical protein